VSLSGDNTLVYRSDSLGNRIPDYSFCGYEAGEKPIPDIPVKAFVPVTDGDATGIIQSAIDHVSSLPAGTDGFRGAVLLDSGTFSVEGRLTIRSAGVVLRGSGTGEERTLIIAAGKDRQTLIRVCGVPDRETITAYPVLDQYVPVNACTLTLGSDHHVKKGDKILINRPGTGEWISYLGMGSFGGESDWLGWKPGRHDLVWDRVVTDTDDETITLDAPLTTALDSRLGGGTVTVYVWPGRIEQVGIENLCLQSACDPQNPKDEDHCWMAITIENTSNAWVRQLTFRHFAGSAVAVLESAGRVTVQDCISLDPVSEIGGMRRQTYFTGGQQILFQRCYAEFGIHDFAAGFCAPGPNAFVQCGSRLPFSFSGSTGSWASGVLFDLVHIDGHALCFKNLGQDFHGAGWNAANSMFWQCSASKIECFSPPGATNWAFGCRAQYAGNGYWENSNTYIRPHSLYYVQLADRLGENIRDRAFLLPADTESTSSPTIEQARMLTELSEDPAIPLAGWIRQASLREPVTTDHGSAKIIDRDSRQVSSSCGQAAAMDMNNGWLVGGGSILTGKGLTVPWWRGSLDPPGVKSAGPHVTRFVPGHTGKGYTDDLEALTDWMRAGNIVSLEHNYGLWYDRRRDDHEQVRRMDGMVWGPFYELPWARSGQGTAWDGLSMYDLTRFNHWYWDRLRRFADLADRKGLVLIHQNYFQHNILEAGAHWVDFPWRPANNINQTGFPEPPPFAGNKRIFMSGQFYDTDHPARKPLHELYIRKCVDNFSNNSNVIQLIGAEYTGPLHFAEFWIDVIAGREEETDRNIIVGLSTTRDVQDAILNDPERASRVDIIDIRYWHYREDGTLYAPEGGKHLSPRQHARLVKPGNVTFSQVYRAVREYREKYPDKPVLCSYPEAERFGWAIFMAGGSLAAIPPVADPGFLSDAVSMHPVDITGGDDQYALGSTSTGLLIYLGSSQNNEIDLTRFSGSYRMKRIDPVTGNITDETACIRGGEKVRIETGKSVPAVLWLKKTGDSE
jgi:hypothetical protein